VLGLLVSGSVALWVAILFTPILIRYFRNRQIGQHIREDGPATHVVKAGTPTMGGIAIVAAVVLGYVIGHAGTEIRFSRTGYLTVGVVVAFGIIGYVDDYIKVHHRRSLGLNKRAKFGAQIGLGLLFALLAVYWAHASTALSFTRYDSPGFEMGTGLWVVWATLLIAAAANAVNLTDGLDGLAIMPAALVASALGIFAYASGNAVFAHYLQIPEIRGAGELLIFCASLAGAGLGFLWFNSYPAQVFMGDVGALAIGAAIGVLAVIVRQELVTLLMGGVFVLETASVILQVASYRLTGRRIFRMAPIHHHFELKGWAEPKVIVRFWIISLLLVLAGLATLKLR